MTVRDLILRFIQGILIGAGGILPGVSGGVLAVLFGVYRPAMEVLAHPKRALSRHWQLLLPVAIGAGLGFLGGSFGLLTLFRRSETAATALFFGLILGTLPSLWRETGTQGRGKASYAALLLGFISMLSLFLLLRFGTFYAVRADFPGFFLAGIIIALGVIIPGFSASPALMAVGLFSPLLRAVSRLDLSALAPLGLGICAAVAALSRLVNRLFRTRYSIASHAVFGIVLASLLCVLPTAFSSAGEGIACFLCAVLGTAAAYYTTAIRPKGTKGTSS